MSSCVLSSSTENFFSLTPRKRMRLPHKVGREERAAAIGHYPGFRGCTIWLTGLSGAGKTTISFHLEKTLIQLGVPAYGLDGDNVRHGLCKNLGFSQAERVENIRRVAEVSKLFADMGMIVLASFISPFRMDRQEARRIHEEEGLDFFEVHVSTPLDVCEARDPKKLYEKARAGKLQGFTGIDSAYEAPENPDLVVQAGVESENKCVQQLLQFLYEKGIVPEEAIRAATTPAVRELFVRDDATRATLVEETRSAPQIELSSIDIQWLQVLAEGWATPLTGFMRERQYLQALHFGQLVEHPRDSTSQNDDTPAPLDTPINQSVAIVLAIDANTKTTCAAASRVRLVYKNKLVAVMRDIEIYAHCKRERAHRQFGCADERHPGVRQVLESGDWLVGGDIEVLERIRYDDGLDKYRKTPLELRAEFAERGADAIFAFQLRNPVHNGHALLMNETRTMLRRSHANPMLLLHPLGGWTKDDDVPLDVRMRQHEALLDAGVLDRAWTILAIFPSPMLYAGPTEVQWHARARQAAGVRAYIVGRDPAGIANPDTGDFLYEPTHGAKVLSMAPGLDELQIIPFRVAAYDKSAKKMSFFEPSRKEEFEFISGTKMRRLAKRGEQPPDGFMEPSAWQVLADYYRGLSAT